MDDTGIKFIGEMERLVVKSGDRFVIKCDRTLSISSREELARIAQRFLGSNAKVLILEPGISIGVIGED